MDVRNPVSSSVMKFYNKESQFLSITRHPKLYTTKNKTVEDEVSRVKDEVGKLNCTKTKWAVTSSFLGLKETVLFGPWYEITICVLYSFLY